MLFGAAYRHVPAAAAGGLFVESSPTSPVQAAKRLRRIEAAVYMEVSAWEHIERAANEQQELAAREEARLFYKEAGRAYDLTSCEELRFALIAVAESESTARSIAYFDERFSRRQIERQTNSERESIQKGSIPAAGPTFTARSPYSQGLTSPLGFVDGVGSFAGTASSDDMSRPSTAPDGTSGGIGNTPSGHFRQNRRKSSVASSAALKELIQKQDAIVYEERDGRVAVDLNERATRHWLSKVVFFDPYYEYLLFPHDRFDAPPLDVVWRREMCIAFAREYQERREIANEAQSFWTDKVHTRSPFTALAVRDSWRFAVARDYVNAHFQYMEVELGLEEYIQRQQLAVMFCEESGNVRARVRVAIVIREPAARAAVERLAREQQCILLAMLHPKMLRTQHECRQRLRRRYFFQLAKKIAALKPRPTHRQRLVTECRESSVLRVLRVKYLRQWIHHHIRMKQVAAVSVMERTAHTILMCRTLTNWANAQHQRMQRRCQMSITSRRSVIRARDLGRRYYRYWYERSKDRLAAVLALRNNAKLMQIMVTRWSNALKWVRRRRKYRQNVIKLTRRAGLWRQGRSMLEWKRFMIVAERIRMKHAEVNAMHIQCETSLIRRYYEQFKFFLKRRRQGYASIRLLGRNNARSILAMLHRWLLFEQLHQSNRRIAPIKDRSRQLLLVPYLNRWKTFSQRHKQAIVDKIWGRVAKETVVRFLIKWMKWRKRTQYKRRMVESNQFDFAIERNAFRYALARWTGWVLSFKERKRVATAVQLMLMRNEAVHRRRYFLGWLDALVENTAARAMVVK